LEGTKKKVHELETKNSNYCNELPYLHKQFTKISKTLGSIDSQQVKLKKILEQEHANQNVVEQSVTFIQKLFILAKGKVKWLEG
jgi:hypothetical protein